MFNGARKKQHITISAGTAHVMHTSEMRHQFQNSCHPLSYLIEGDYFEYGANLLEPSTFAGIAEVIAIANVLETPIEVYTLHRESSYSDNDGPGTQVPLDEDEIAHRDLYGGQFERNGDRRIRVAYNGVNHYNAVILQAEPTKKE